MKYIGSKAKIANDIVEILQGYISQYGIKQYIEPFAGGFNVIDKIRCEYRLGNDIDPLVCELVEACRETPALLDELHTPTREEYYAVRDNADKYPLWYRAAVLLFGSYNARVYGGCYGATAKTKSGKIRDYFNEARENFRRQLPALRGIHVGNADYRDLRLPARESVLVYCDPPYSDGIGYGGGKFDTAQFWEWCRMQAQNGHIVVISEYAAPDDFAHRLQDLEFTNFTKNIYQICALCTNKSSNSFPVIFSLSSRRAAQLCSTASCSRMIFFAFP